MTEDKTYDDYPGVETDLPSPSFEELFDLRERQLRRAYKLGVLHGINAQSMAQVKNDVMSFDDYGWDFDE